MLPRYRELTLARMTSAASCAGKIINSSSLEEKIDDSSTMLLYEIPSGFAIISFGGVDLNIPVEDLWAYPPQNVCIKECKKFEEKSTAIDLANEAIGSDLTEMLTRFCGSEQELLVGSAEYKRIIEGKLAITCRYDIIVEEVISGLENIMYKLLPEETSEPKEYRLPRDKGGLILFLRQYDFDVKEDMVNRSVVEAARLLYHLDLHEQQFLKLLCGSIKEFVDELSVTKDWSILKFATALKLFCYPRGQYQIAHPSKIFSAAEYERITSIKPQYRKMIMSKIHVVSVYENAIALYGKRMTMVWNIDCLLPKKAKPKKLRIWKNHSSGELNSTDLPTGSKVGKEAITDFDGMLNSATDDNCSGVSVLKSSELDLSDRPRQVVTCDKQAADTDAKQASAARSMDETEDKNLTRGTHGLVGDKQDGVIPAIIARSGPKQNEENHANSSRLNSRPTSTEINADNVQGTDDASKKMTAQWHANKSEAKQQPLETRSNGIKGVQSEDEEKRQNEVPSTSLGNVEQTHETSSDGSNVVESINDVEKKLTRGTHDLVGDKGVQSEDEEKRQNEVVPSTSLEIVEQTHETTSDGSNVLERINDGEKELTRGTDDLVGDKQDGVITATSTRFVPKQNEENSANSARLNSQPTSTETNADNVQGTDAANVEQTHETSSDGSNVLESINDEKKLTRGTHDLGGDKQDGVIPATSINKSESKKQPQETSANGTNGVQNADVKWQNEQVFSTSGRLKLRDLLAETKREEEEASTNACLKSCMPFICCRSVH